MNDNFCAFILTHGRPDNVRTYQALKNHGYTGKIYIIIDNEDKTANEYYKKFGEEVIMFDKKEMSYTFDEADNFGDRKTIVYARNFCFVIAKKLGIKNFVQLDDDYYWFGHRTVEKAITTRNLDIVFEDFTHFLNTTPITTVAFSQGGDTIGGYNENKKVKRKAMNSFFCSTDKPFQFVGRINEDVSTYIQLGGLGKVFLTIIPMQLSQGDSQQNKGGMTDIYNSGGTYIKSFYSVIFNPSCIKVKTITGKFTRMHHGIKWENAVAKIIQEIHKK